MSKRPQVALVTIDTDGTEVYRDTFRTMKDAQKVARELALQRLRATGIQTEYHSA